MGQAIDVQTAEVGGAVIFTTDRSITGQDGVSYASPEEAATDDRFPGRLATELYEADDSLHSVFVASNQVVVTRAGGWDEDSVGRLSKVVAEFFLFY